MDNLLCHICGYMYNNMERLKRHLKNHNNSYNCPECKYSSLRKDTLNRHTKTNKRQLLSRFEAQIPERTTWIETRAYQADPRNINSYIYQQSLPKNKEIFLWILYKLDTQTKTSRPYHQLEPIIIPLESTEPLQDARPHPEATTSLSEEIYHLLNQEYAISASLSELDIMLRNLESEENREEETNANEDEDNEDIWKLIDSI